MSIEKKAHEAHDANRALKEKYHIPYNCWIDWFTKGYQRAEEDCKPKWISIESREIPMPNDEDILIRIQDGSIRRYDEDWEAEFGLDGTVTHWMAIPKFNE